MSLQKRTLFASQLTAYYYSFRSCSPKNNFVQIVNSVDATLSRYHGNVNKCQDIFFHLSCTKRKNVDEHFIISKDDYFVGKLVAIMLSLSIIKDILTG